MMSRIEQHQQRVAAELKDLGQQDHFAGFRACRKHFPGKPKSSASGSTVLLARLGRLAMMLRNPGWSLRKELAR